MTYQQHIQRVLAKHHARLELGLAQARQQERFVERVADIFYKNHIVYTFHLNDDFDAIFYLKPFSGYLNRHCLNSLFPHFDVEIDGAEWIVSHRQFPEIQAILRKDSE